ncbi:unnamed protein product [Rotaria sp. Silwood2]|nr:unnamed protein product [Rotaria sp. Silwood2]CAF2498460.1 unnamed protein product [Rotaria sp. Silwood2]CAF2813961.1 unnamed protein product [Rotaria sp. Silwood2]CAF3920786.1 unnamed protein product [Rotaria sp. Silwood2]CAF3970365.1 unnamed protein product [Rotaria sp. Silwood2]
MQVDTRWAQPVVSDLVSVPIDNNNNKHNIEQQQLSVHSLPLSTLQTQLATTTTPITSFFPPQRVEPIDMARSQQPTTQNRTKTGYIQSATTDEQQTTTINFIQNQSIKRVKHPADRSSIVFLFQYVSTICFGIFISFPCIILLTVLLPICWLIRTFVRLICRHHCTVTPCACNYLSASDLFWFYNSNISTNQDNKNHDTRKYNSRPMSPIAAAVFFLEGTINENSLKKLLINRLITSSVRRGTNIGRKLFPRFSQLVVSRFSGTMWVDYSLFSIDEHVHEISHNIQSDEELQSYISTLLSNELPRNRPLWQLYYKNRLTIRPNDSILIFLYHPVLSDGISLLRILLKHIVDNRTTQLDIKPRFAGQHGEHVMFDYLKAYLFGHKLIFSKLLSNTSRENFFKRILFKNKTNNHNNTSTINSNTQQQQQQRVVVWSTPFSLTQANRMKLVTRTRMNNLLSTLVISTVKLYMERYGIINPANINCIMPCDLRSNVANIIMGNQLSHLCIELPMDVEGNIPILWSFNDSTKHVKENGDYATMYLFTHIIYLLFPFCFANKIIARIYNSASVWLTSLAAGSSTALATVSICNRDVRSLICLSPSIGTASLNFCVTSYADEIRLVVIADPNVIPNPRFLTECFNQQLNVVQDLLAHRRIPGEIRRIIRPPKILPQKKSISSISDMSEDLSIEEIQAKMTTLQQELLSLKSQFENVDMNDASCQTQRLIITTKLEELRREFRELLIKLQERQCELSGMIPSDEEDEMDPHVRVRLRSASVASKVSLRSNEQRQLSAKMYQLEKDDGSEFHATIVHKTPSPSKMSLSVHQVQDQQINMRRAQSVSICENTPADMQSRTTLNHPQPTTTTSGKFETATNTIVHLHPSENWKNGN